MRSVSCASVVAFAFASPALAEMKEVAPGHYVCSAPAGHFRNQDILPLQVGQQMRIWFRLNRENFDPKWTVAAAVQFAVPTGRRGVVFGKARDEREHMFVALHTEGAEARKTVDRFPVTAEWVQVRLKLDAKGVVTVRSRDRTELLDLGTTQISKAFLHCHSGEFEIRIAPVSYVRPTGAPVDASRTSAME